MKRAFAVGGMVVVAAAMGCGKEEAPTAFEYNLVHAHKYAMTEDLPMDQVVEDTQWALHRLFGTPDEPKLPEVVLEDEELSSLVSLENLQRAAGPAPPAGEEGDRGLYRQHCASCHGVTGNGRGLTGALLNPYPRDYRMGLFKFKSTVRGAKPTRDDLATVIRHGIPGTPMVPIPQLTEEDVQALVDYVIYLSWRGEVERRMIDDAVLELDLETQRIVNPSLANSEDEEEKERFAEQWDYIVGYVTEIGESWLEAEDSVTEVELPQELPLPKNREEFVAMMSGPEAEALQKSVDRGRQLFVGSIAACSKCHGPEGKGDGQTNDFDDWTKDWTVRVGLDPTNREQLIPLLARGALLPQNVQPRNFAEGVFRGGSEPEDLYRRIVNGIDGTPMPGATFVEGEFEERDVWHLVNFVRSLENPDQAAQTAEQAPQAAEPAA